MRVACGRHTPLVMCDCDALWPNEAIHRRGRRRHRRDNLLAVQSARALLRRPSSTACAHNENNKRDAAATCSKNIELRGARTHTHRHTSLQVSSS